MTKSHRPHLDADLREILENLADGLFPLQRWIKDKDDRKVPPPHIVDESGGTVKLPWRIGKTLSPKSIGAIDLFEHLLSESEDEEKLLERWEKLEDNPLEHFHLQGKDATAWRVARGLDRKTQFGVLESENTLVDVDDHPIVRKHFYEAFWPLLREAVRRKDPKQDWLTFAADLHTDKSSAWPAGQPLRSSTLTFQFSRDLLYAMMNMDNDAPEPWKHALLIELGEHRRVGNEWTRIDAQHAVDDFEAKVAEARATERPAELGEALVASTDLPPVGTPPQRPFKGRRSPLVEEV